jgi:hypothetical protein
MKMKLLGVGRPPETPNPIVATPASSSKITVSWGHGRNIERNNKFPVHKYIVQRLDNSDSWNNFLWLNVIEIQQMFKLNRFRN